MSRCQGICLVFALAPGVWLSYAEFDHTHFARPPLYFGVSALQWLPHFDCVCMSHMWRVPLDGLEFPPVFASGAQCERDELCCSSLVVSGLSFLLNTVRDAAVEGASPLPGDSVVRIV